MKKIVSLLLSVCLLLAVMPISQLGIVATASTTVGNSEFAGGAGTQDDPYLISTKEHLNNVRNYLDASYKMIGDVIFSDADFAEGGAFYNKGTGWTPIGDPNSPFVGSFNGNGHIIQNLYIKIDIGFDNTITTRTYAGLFGYVKNSTIRQLGMVDSKIEVSVLNGRAVYAGGIAGFAEGGSFYYCYNTGSMYAGSTLSSFAGGIVGCGGDGFWGCYNTGSIHSHAALESIASIRVVQYSFAGGISGTSGDTPGIDSVGNIVPTKGVFRNCYNIGDILAEGGGQSISYAGGISGTGYYYYKCYNAGKITSKNSGSMWGATSTAFAGGIVGAGDNAETDRCYNAADIKASADDAYIGGIIGFGYTVSSCYNIGNILGSTSSRYRGGIAGYITLSSTCYYLDNTYEGIGELSSSRYPDRSVKRTSAEMQKQETFGEFDFESDWFISSKGYSYPQLISNPHYKSFSIEITKKPNKLAYLEGESFDTTGMVVTVYYEDNTREVVSDYTVSGYSPTPGSKTITVSYKGKTATFTVNVTALTLTSIAVTTKPNKLTYHEGDTFDSTGMIVTAYYNNSTSTVVTDYTVSGYTSAPGTNTITITYSDKTATFAVNVTAHTYGNWTSVDASSHKHTCSVCSKEETASHAWNAGVVTKQPSCKEPGIRTYTCTVCGGTKTESITKLTTHTYGNWTSVDANSHKHTCSVCSKEETAPHAWNVGAVTKQPSCKESGIRTYTCTVCGGTKTENIDKLTTHTYDNACDTTCNICGSTRTVPHQYSSVWTTSKTEHWHECNLCGDKKDLSTHTPGATATEHTAQTCTQCGYIIQAALGHIHNYSNTPSYNREGHWYACVGCSEQKDYAAHVYNNSCDTDCNVCGYVRTITHSYATAWTYDANNHWHACAVCGAKAEETAHVPGAAATETTSQNCVVCGFEMVPAVGHTHTFGEYWLSDSESHWKACPCGEKAELAKHSWESGFCTVCGASDPNATQPTDPSTNPTEPSTSPNEPGTEPSSGSTEPSISPTEPQNPVDNNEGGNSTWIVLAIVGIICVAGGIAAGVIISKKKR